MGFLLGLEAREQSEVSSSESVETERCGESRPDCFAKGIQNDSLLRYRIALFLRLFLKNFVFGT